MPGPAAALELTVTEVRQLTALVRAGTTPQRLVRRARLILGSSAGLGSRDAEVYAEALAARLRRGGLAAEGRGVGGQPAPAIISAASDVDADLIVMSTQARTGPARSIAGSVADEVVRRSSRPVLLVRRGAHLSESDKPPSGHYGSSTLTRSATNVGYPSVSSGHGEDMNAGGLIGTPGSSGKPIV
jgi:nucleotide-binding universal stress UspA family protein